MRTAPLQRRHVHFVFATCFSLTLHRAGPYSVEMGLVSFLPGKPGSYRRFVQISGRINRVFAGHFPLHWRRSRLGRPETSHQRLATAS